MKLDDIQFIAFFTIYSRGHIFFIIFILKMEKFSLVIDVSVSSICFLWFLPSDSSAELGSSSKIQLKRVPSRIRWLCRY